MGIYLWEGGGLDKICSNINKATPNSDKKVLGRKLSEIYFSLPFCFENVIKTFDYFD